MKYKFNTLIVNEIEIELPIYFKINNANGYFALYEKQAIVVYNDFDICKSNFPQNYFKYINSESYEVITKEHFVLNLEQEYRLLISKI
jgi:hypothetical protein